MLMGAIPAFIWAAKKPMQFDIFGYAVAAGLIAGEGIGGVVNAIFEIVRQSRRHIYTALSLLTDTHK